MIGEIGFNNELYIAEQSRRIRQRLERFERLYLEFGGKLFDDYHAAGFCPALI